MFPSVCDNLVLLLAERCNCIAKFVYCYSVSSVVVVCDTSVLWQQNYKEDNAVFTEK